jgi:organic radical activating enzyme
LPGRTGAPSIEALIYQTQKQGILPLSSVCGASCIFCSNKYNPPTCETLLIPPRSLKDIKETLAFLEASSGAIVIGESVTRISEGEPLSHPQFLEVIRMVRRSIPKRPIKVTTNGMLLTDELIDALAELDVSLTVSLNTLSKRKEIMGDTDDKRTIRAVSRLRGRLSFEGSIVALPFLTGWEDLGDTVNFLLSSGAEGVRVMAPSFSKFHPLFEKMPSDTWNKLRQFITKNFSRSKYPVIVEPQSLDDLEPRIEHVLPNTPAANAGLKKGEVIVKVQGKPVFSRKDAFTMAWEFASPEISVFRDGGIVDVRVVKERRSPPGFVIFDDLDKDQWMDWEVRSGVRRGRDVLVLTSSMAKPIIEAALRNRNLEAKVVAVRSLFFGGNIQASGLLTIRDYLEAYRLETNNGYDPALVTLPARSFDPWGRDLEGVHWKYFVEETGKPVVLAG